MSTVTPGTRPPASRSPRRTEIHLVFSGRADLAVLKLLRPGFRHCFALVQHGDDRWTLVDPMASTLAVEALSAPDGISLPDWYRTHGHRVIPAGAPVLASRPAPIGIFSCVEVCKRLLGIRRIGLLTPYQLYRWVMERHGQAGVGAGRHAPVDGPHGQRDRSWPA